MRGDGATMHFEVAADDEMFEVVTSFDLDYVPDAMHVGVYAGNYAMLMGDTQLSFEAFEVCEAP